MATNDLPELLARIRADDHQAFEHLFELYWRALYQYAYKVVQQACDAEDLTQELFCDLWSNRARLCVPTCAEAYLLGALRKKILTRFRDAGTRARHLALLGAGRESGAETTLRALVSYDSLALIRVRAQEILPPREKEVFLLSMLEDFSVKEIAEKLATSEQTVRNQINSALHKLSPFLTRLFS